MIDWWMVAVGIVGVGLAFFYFCVSHCLLRPRNATSCFDGANPRYLLEDYRTTNQEIARRENITLVIGTIFVAASFLILSDSLGQTTGSRYKFAVVSILLYSLWLFIMHCTKRWIDNLSYERMRAMEKGVRGEAKYEFGIHEFLYGKTQGMKRMIVRRAFWGIPLLVLGLFWLFSGLLAPCE